MKAGIRSRAIPGSTVDAIVSAGSSAGADGASSGVVAAGLRSGAALAACLLLFACGGSGSSGQEAATDGQSPNGTTPVPQPVAPSGTPTASALFTGCGNGRSGRHQGGSGGDRAQQSVVARLPAGRIDAGHRESGQPAPHLHRRRRIGAPGGRAGRPCFRTGRTARRGPQPRVRHRPHDLLHLLRAGRQRHEPYRGCAGRTRRGGALERDRHLSADSCTAGNAALRVAPGVRP